MLTALLNLSAVCTLNLLLFLCRFTHSFYNDFRQKTCKLISSLAKIHCSNYFLGWGDEWQSAEWAENIGFGAWLEWDNLTLRDKINIANMIIHEADRFINYKVPYYKDKSGKLFLKAIRKVRKMHGIQEF